MKRVIQIFVVVFLMMANSGFVFNLSGQNTDKLPRTTPESEGVSSSGIVDFLNAIISALETNKVDWAEYFYNKNKNRIFPSLQEDTLNLAKAQILYMRKNFNDAIKLINNVSYNNHYFYLRSKMLLSRLYYDKNELEPIIYLIDAAKHFLKRNKKVTKMNRDAFGNFFYFMTKIFNLQERKNPNIKEVKDELIKQTNVSSKEWLLKKLDEMD